MYKCVNIVGGKASVTGLAADPIACDSEFVLVTGSDYKQAITAQVQAVLDSSAVVGTPSQPILTGEAMTAAFGFGFFAVVVVGYFGSYGYGLAVKMINMIR